MATGDQNDIQSRLFRWLPTGWFPNDAGTRIYALLSGFASVLALAFQQIGYARHQTRIATATDGFLDLASQDYLADALPRLTGETDTAYSARIRANIFLSANTREAIQNAVELVTGSPVRMIEPWQPNDTFVWGRSFWGVNTTANPGQWSNGDRRAAGLVVCALPVTGISGIPRSWWGSFFWAQGQTYAQPSGAWWLQLSGTSGAQLVYDAINRLKVFGTAIYVKFVSPSELP